MFAADVTNFSICTEEAKLIKSIIVVKKKQETTKLLKQKVDQIEITVLQHIFK